MPLIHASHVDTWLGDTQVLHDVSLKVGAGEVLAILGDNGSGKTTLLRTLLGLVPHHAGTVELFGTPLRAFHDWSRIGYVCQRGHVQAHNATVREIVGFGRLATRRLFRPASRADREATGNALERVGMAAFADRPLAHLSGGQQQRVLIARALAGDGDVLVLDEPLAAVDLATQEALAELLSRLHHDGITIVTVLHELSALEPLLQRCIVLRDGAIDYDGPLEGR